MEQKKGRLGYITCKNCDRRKWNMNWGSREKQGFKVKEAGSSFLYSPNLEHRRIRFRSSHLVGSKSSWKVKSINQDLSIKYTEKQELKDSINSGDRFNNASCKQKRRRMSWWICPEKLKKHTLSKHWSLDI